MTKQRRVIAYIDGFNLFYSSLKGTENKWLDLEKLVSAMLKPNDVLVGIRYFTAKVSSNKNEPEKALKQHVYLEALSLNPKIQTRLGRFSVHTTKMPDATAWNKGKIKMVDVIKTEEKGTDVNLAVQMVADAKDDLFDYAMLFSNDSDMAYAIQIATQQCNKQIGLYVARRATSYQSLKEHVLHIKRLGSTAFANAQLPEEITTPTGRVIKKPSDW